MIKLPHLLAFGLSFLVTGTSVCLSSTPSVRADELNQTVGEAIAQPDIPEAVSIAGIVVSGILSTASLFAAVMVYKEYRGEQSSGEDELLKSPEIEHPELSLAVLPKEALATSVLE